MQVAITEMMASNIFDNIPGRSHVGFEGYRFDPYDIDGEKLLSKIKDRRRDIANSRKLQLSA